MKKKKGWWRGKKKKIEPNTDDTAVVLWKGEQEGYCGCPHVIGKEPQYLPSLSIIKAATAVEQPALKCDWRSFDEADGQLQGSRLLGRHWPARERERASEVGEGRVVVRRTGRRRVRAAKNIRRLNLDTFNSSGFVFSKVLDHYRRLWFLFFSLFQHVSGKNCKKKMPQV